VGLTGRRGRCGVQVASPRPIGSRHHPTEVTTGDANVAVHLDRMRPPVGGRRPLPRLALDEGMELFWEPLPV
jgi:hypothetical protein